MTGIDAALLDAQRLLGDATAAVQALAKLVEAQQAENKRLTIIAAGHCAYCGWKRGAE